MFEKKAVEENVKHALSTFDTDSIFTREEIEKMERMRLDYKNITRKLTKDILKDVLDRFTANFTYESNALEGNSLTLKDVSIVMFENASVEGKDLREIYETRNSRKVVEIIIRGGFDVSHRSIMRMHKLLMKDIDSRFGYKKVPNIIFGSRIETSLPENVDKDMDKLIKWYKDNKEKMHPVKLAALFHGRFEQIHPFQDGNGRVGRFLINVILTKHRYPPLIIRKSQRIAYLKALGDFDIKHTNNLERLILERFKDTYRKFFEMYVKYV